MNNLIYFVIINHFIIIRRLVMEGDFTKIYIKKDHNCTSVVVCSHFEESWRQQWDEMMERKSQTCGLWKISLALLLTLQLLSGPISKTARCKAVFLSWSRKDLFVDWSCPNRGRDSFILSWNLGCFLSHST